MTEKDCKHCKHHVRIEPCYSCYERSNFEEYIPQPDALQVLHDVKQYLLGALKEWPNLQAYIVIKAELYVLEAYAERHGFKL